MELPKTPRQPVKSPSKGKKSEPVKPEPLFDYHEGLVYDIALKTHLHRAYQLFKVPFSGDPALGLKSADTVEGSDQARLFHLDLGWFRPASSRTPAREILYGLGMVLGYGRATRFLFAPWWVKLSTLNLPAIIVLILPW